MAKAELVMKVRLEGVEEVMATIERLREALASLQVVVEPPATEESK